MSSISIDSSLLKGFNSGSTLMSFANKAIQYKYYNNYNELVSRLSLLCASIDAGNNSTEIRNEISEILDILLNNNVINKNEHKKISVNFL